MPTLTALENVELIAELPGATAPGGGRRLLDVGLGERPITSRPSSPAASSSASPSRARSSTARRCCSATSRRARSTSKRGARARAAAARRAPAARTVLVVTHNAAVGRDGRPRAEMRYGRIGEDRRNSSPLDAGSWTGEAALRKLRRDMQRPAHPVHRGQAHGPSRRRAVRRDVRRVSSLKASYDRRSCASASRT